MNDQEEAWIYHTITDFEDIVRIHGGLFVWDKLSDEVKLKLQTMRSLNIEEEHVPDIRYEEHESSLEMPYWYKEYGYDTEG